MGFLIPKDNTEVVSKEWHRDSEVREEGEGRACMVGRVWRDEGKSVAEVLQVLDSVPSPSVHAMAVFRLG